MRPGHVTDINVVRGSWVRARRVQKTIDEGIGGESTVVQIRYGEARRKGPIYKWRVDCGGVKIRLWARTGELTSGDVEVLVLRCKFP